MSLLCPCNNKDANRVLIYLIVCEIIFAIIYFLDFSLGEPIFFIHELFNLDQEANIPSWFSTIQLFLIGLVALIVSCEKRHTPPPSRTGLTVFGLGFVYLSMDEASIIHEKMTHAFYNNPWVPYFHGQHGVWIVVYMCVAIVVITLLYKDIGAVFKMFPRESIIFSLGMFIFLLGSGGMETLTFFYLDKSNLLFYTMEVVIEEFLEMFGASIIFYSVLRMAIKKLDRNNSPAHV